MYAMHYEIGLPADYDMNIIKDRVARTGAALDNWPGLGLKAYLIRENGKAGASANAYAPFYLWADIDGMNRFLWGGGAFSAIVRSFPRPFVRHWTGVSFSRGAEIADTPEWAVIERTPLKSQSDPAFEVEAAVETARAHATKPGCHSHAIGVDPATWEIVHFSLWTQPLAQDEGAAYRVLHLSRPGLKTLSAWADREKFKKD